MGVQAETEVTIHEPQVPVPKVFLTPPGNFSTYMQGLLEMAQAKVDRETTKLAEAMEGLAAAERAVIAQGNDIHVTTWRGTGDWAKGISTQIRRWKIRRNRHLREKGQATKFLEALAAGYVPIPTLPAIHLGMANILMPADVLDSYVEAKNAGVFEDFRVVTGQEASAGGWPTSQRTRGRDPILVGMIANEMFAVAWWRPE